MRLVYYAFDLLHLDGWDTVYTGLREDKPADQARREVARSKARTQVRLTQGSIAKDEGNTAEQETAGVDV